jgi:hypothetical protein
VHMIKACLSLEVYVALRGYSLALLEVVTIFKIIKTDRNT